VWSNLSKFRVDTAIIYVVITKLFQAGGGAMSIFFIAKYLTKEEQGYYYTFGSILAVQMFFDLGFSTIITQFVAAEFAFLKLEGSTGLVGSEKSLSRLSFLLRFCLKWFSITAVVFIVFLLCAGYLFFTKFGMRDLRVEWRIPWVILAVATATNFMVSPILAFLEGLGKVKEVAKIRFIQQVFQLISLFSFLVLGFKLFSVSLAAFVSVSIVIFLILLGTERKLLNFIYLQLKEWKIDYKKEIFPFQWRIALSWISGYFIFQLFNPLVFATEGATVAGQMGMTLVALGGILSVSMSWIHTKVPSFSSYIALKDYTLLDFTFNRALVQTSIISAFSLVVFNSLVYLLQYNNHSLGNRFLPVGLTLLLSIATFINQFVGALGTYLRCHKQEPFLNMSLVMAIFTASTIYFVSKSWGIYGVVLCYTSIVSASLLWGTYIFRLKKKEWHSTQVKK